MIGQDQVQEQVTIDRIICFKCMEYNHFAKDCPYIRVTEKGQTEHMQQMLQFRRVRDYFEGSYR